MKSLFAWLSILGLGLAVGTLRAQKNPSNSTSTSPLDSSATTATNLDQETRDLKPRDVLKYSIDQDANERGSFFNPVIITELGDAQFQVSSGSQAYVKVKAAGRKLADVRKDLKQLLDADYYVNSTINVDLQATAPKDPSTTVNNLARVTVYGAINATVPLSDDRKKMLSETIAGLGAQRQNANLKKVEIFRKDPSSKQPIKLVKNVKVMLEDGDVREDIELLDGDMIHVIEKVFQGL